MDDSFRDLARSDAVHVSEVWTGCGTVMVGRISSASEAEYGYKDRIAVNLCHFDEIAVNHVTEL